MKTTPQITQPNLAAAWILKALCTNNNWFDDIRHAGEEHYEREYHYIPLIDIAQSSGRFDIKTLKDACYLLQGNNHVDIWGDDYEVYGMLVQVSDEGVMANEEMYYGKIGSSFVKRAIGVFATVTTIAALAIGINKTIIHKHPAHTGYNNTKTTGGVQKSTAFEDTYH